MTKPSRGKSRLIESVKQKTLVAHQTKHRIHAIVAMVIGELDQRRASGKSDYVAALADNLETGDIAAWKALRDLLPRDEVVSDGGTTNVQIGSLFATIAAQVGARGREAMAPSQIIDAPVHSASAVQEVIETNAGEDDDGQGAVEW